MTSNKYRTAKIVTPGGWIISLDEDHWPKNYPGFTNEVAAKAMASLSGCKVTIEELSLYSCGPDEKS